MNKFLICMLMLLGALSGNLQAGWVQDLTSFTVELSASDRKLLHEVKESIKQAGSGIPKGVTQAGIVLTSTATAVLSAYAVFLIIRYELSIQPDVKEERNHISWKTALGSTFGTTIFAASVAALIKSSAIAEYAIKN